MTPVRETTEALPGVPLETGAVVGLSLVAATLAITPWILAVARRLFPGRNVVFARWGFSHVVLATFLWLVLSMSFAPLVAEGAGLHVLLLAGATVQGTVCAVIAYWASKRDPAGVRALGLWPGLNLRAMAVGLGTYFLCLPGIIGLGVAWPWLLSRVDVPFEEQPYARGLLELSGGQLGLAIALAVLVVPLLEEILFRSFLQPLLVQNFRDKGGVLLTAALFAALHGTSAFLMIFGLSLVLGAIMLRTQRLLAVWAIHAVHNGWQVALFVFAPELVPEGGGAPLLF